MAEGHFLGNPNLRAAGYHHDWTIAEVKESYRCSKDPVYFIRKYVKVVQVDRGLVPFDLYDFQEDMVHTFHDNRFVICKLPRQSGKSTTIIAYFLWYILFNPNVNVAVLANKGETAQELLEKVAARV
jgi:hypothetical protein